MPGFSRFGQSLAVGFLHLMTCGISMLVKRGSMRHCPQCRHLQSRHLRRADGSFID
jgi:hypothetical protein